MKKYLVKVRAGIFLVFMSLLDVSYFICSDCKTVLPVPERVLESDGFFFNCSFCSRPISLRNIYKNESLEIIESFGCNYGGIEKPSAENIRSKKVTDSKVDHWISDSVSQANYHLDSSQGVQEVSVVEGSASKWDVQTQDGRTFKFDFFSEVRKAVLDGKISPGDFIIPFEGAKHPIEDYPGTADLFGNQYSKTKIGLREIPEWKPISNSSRLRLENIIYGSLLICIVVTGYFAFPYVADYWKANRGEALLRKFAASASGISKETLLKKTSTILQKPEITELTSLAAEWSSYIANNPEDLIAIGSLSQVFAEIGFLKHDDSLKKAEYLAHVIKKHSASHHSYLASQSRILWRKNRPLDGILLLEKGEPLSAENSFLMGTLHLQTGDNTKAVIYFSEAYSKDPSNSTYLLALVDLYERESKFKEIAGFLQKGLEQNPEDTAIEQRLISTFKKSKDIQSLEDFYRNMMIRGKRPDESHYQLISFLYEENRHDDVVRETSIFLSKFSTSTFTAQVSNLRRNARDKIEEAKVAAAKAASEAAERPRSRRSRRVLQP